MAQSLTRRVPLGINGQEIPVVTSKPTASWVSEGGQKPTTIEPPRTLRTALQLMHRHDFSQLPVYEDAAFVGLLTNNAVARWMADQLHHHDRIAEDTPVSEVLPFAEDSDRVRAAYGANYQRLAEVKRRWDPDNLFRANRNVAPAG